MKSETTSVAARLAYGLTATTSVSLRYQALRRVTDLVRTRENAGVLSLIKRF